MKLFPCGDRRAPKFRHDKGTLRLKVDGTNYCVDDWGTDNQIRLKACGGDTDQKWIPMWSQNHQGYAFMNAANDCVIDDIGGPNVWCEDPASINKDDFADSQVFVGLGNDFID